MLVDASGAGSEVDCPGCGNVITVPAPSATNVHPMNPMASSAAAKEEKHFSVPVHDAPAESLIQKPNRPLEVAAKDTEKKPRIKTIRRTDCVEVGKDKFDEVVTDFLNKVGHENIINISPINYSHVDIGTRALLTDYGLLIVYRG
jgi:hypothetical protein